MSNAENTGLEGHDGHANLTAEVAGPTQIMPTGAVCLTPQVREYIRASKALNTLRGYQTDWRDFCAWCEPNGQCPIPAAAESIASTSPNAPGTCDPGASNAA